MRGVIVTGGTGFIGGQLAEELRHRYEGCTVIALGSVDVDLSDRDATFGWFERMHWLFECDHLFHLAALYKAGDWPVTHQATQFYANMSINTNVLEAWRRFFPRAKLTSVLSYCMYPPSDTPHREDELYGTEPEDYLFAYAFTKKMLLIGQKAYAREHGLISTSVVLPTVYGPNDSFAENSHVVGALIGKFLRAARNNSPSVEVWGDGKQRREFLHVGDATSGIIAAALGVDIELVNIGTGITHSVEDVANLIAATTGFNGSIFFNNNRFVGVNQRSLNISRSRELLSWQPSVPLHDGIARTVSCQRSKVDPILKATIRRQ